MRKLTCLQTLFNFVVTKRSGCGIEELKSVVDLRGSLYISKLENVTTTERAKEADLKSKHHLHKLTLRWSEENPLNLWNDVHEKGVLECLHPNKNVKVLRIENFSGTRFPSWMKNVSLSNLVSIYIINCQKCETLPPLWQLPLLKNLKIHGIHGLIHIGRDFYGDGMVVGFPSLEKLEMKAMPNLKHWSGFEAGEIPCFCELTIWDCPKMTELPNLPSIIITLEIFNCRGFESFPMLHSIQKVVFGKCNEVVINAHIKESSLAKLNFSVGTFEIKVRVLDNITVVHWNTTFSFIVGHIWKDKNEEIFSNLNHQPEKLPNKAGNLP
ncbi:hypothetical protein F0562_010197 [Nyssa sinensis]|uniref:R13L1/DRL21-like LRR repeat region domain-containing protein n=1 Tax=Nyssa sinensis TaxID=561372 RepID=A0A5J5A0U8_9ASTE|nr:hypothetical protein F0562_010197 [Nyssa sinensis]